MMKFSNEDTRPSVQPNWSHKTLKSETVNNCVKEPPEQQNSRPKSVLFSGSSTGFISNDDDELPLSPGSDSSKVSKTDNRKKSISNAGDDSENCRLRRQSHSLSVSSDMDDNVAVKSAWKTFEDSIKNINDTTDYYSQIPKPSFKSSDAFQKVMVDLYGNPEYGQKIGYTQLKGKVEHISAMTSRMLTRRRAKKEETNAHKDEVDSIVKPPPSKTTVDNAKRGWAILRQHVQEKISQNRCKASNLKWTMLGQTLRAMSNTESTRMDLYQRYGLLPKLNSNGQFVKENTMLSERARSILRPSVNPFEIQTAYKPQLRAQSSFLPRHRPSNTNAYKQRPCYSRQSALSFRLKAT